MARIRLVRFVNCPVPTRWGWAVIVAVLLGGTLWAGSSVYPFLAQDRPVAADVLVVEGWVPDYAIVEAVQEFGAGAYHLLVVTGGHVDKGFFLSAYKTYAELGAATARAAGLDSARVVAVSAPLVYTDRTKAAATALRSWMDTAGVAVRGLNVISLGPHARRTRLIFSRVLGSEVAVGIISCRDRGYQGRRWWRTSEGVRKVIDELVAYGYAVVFLRGK